MLPWWTSLLGLTTLWFLVGSMVTPTDSRHTQGIERLALWSSFCPAVKDMSVVLIIQLTALQEDYPSELLEHALWWNGPPRLIDHLWNWPQPTGFANDGPPEEECGICLVNTVAPHELIPLIRYSSYIRLKCVTAWMVRFVNNCRKNPDLQIKGLLSVTELDAAERIWIMKAQFQDFQPEIEDLVKNHDLPMSSSISHSIHYLTTVEF